MKDKVLHLNSAFSVKAADSAEGSIYIEGYASTIDVDRHGDVVPSTVWEKGMQNYLKNPVILAYHDHNNPIGRMTEHKTDGKGLWIKARISTAAKQFQLIKDGVLTAFSIGFRVLDAEYNSAAEVFLIKDLELVEISVVSVPANQNTLFDLSKAFDDAEEYKRYKEQFATQGQSAKGLECSTEADRNVKKEWNMNPEEIKQMLAQAAREAAEQATKALEARQQAEATAKAQEVARQAEIDARVKAAVQAQIEVGQSGAEKLLAEVEKRFETERAAQKSALEGLESALKEKADELKAIQASKMTFNDKVDGSESSYEEREKAVLLSKLTRKAIGDTKYGRNLIEKKGPRAPAGTVSAPDSIWETEVSLNMENEVRRRLVMAPLMRGINMQTNVMRIPLNPEAGLAQWVANTDFGNTNNNSSGNTATHSLGEITLRSYKVATREYMAFEEEEDSLIVLLPIVRDAMLRRVARTIDRAMMYGTGANAADPVKGIASYDPVGETGAVTPLAPSATVTVANLRSLRKAMGAWGLDPSELVYVVSTDVYYDLLEDSTFQTMDKVGTQATLLTGQIGSIANTPVVVSGELPGKADDALGAFCFATANFLVGNQRGLRVDTDELIERQSRVLVASLRTGLTQLTTNLGSGVRALRFNA